MVATLELVDEFCKFTRETRTCCREGKLGSYTDLRVVFRQWKLLSNMVRESNNCTKICKASIGLLKGSIKVQDNREMY